MDAILERVDTGNTVCLVVRNTGATRVRLVRERLGLDALDGNYFDFEGEAVTYHGFIRHTRPYCEDETLVLDPQQEVRVTLDLAGSYDIPAGRPVRVRYASTHRSIFGAVSVESNWVDL